MNALVLIAAIVATTFTANSAVAEDAKPKREIVKSGDYELVLPLGLQADSAYIPEDNPLSAEKVSLGKLLFFDKRLSKDGNISCASCHNPFHGFADTDPTSSGVGFLTGLRNSPTSINRLFSAEQFWDGRAKDLEEQSHGPLTNPVEMAMASHDDVVKEVARLQGYAPLFEKAFGKGEITMPRIAQAIASYERTVLAGNAPYDRYRAGNKGAMSAEQVKGLELFEGKADCATCHVSFNFSDEMYHNLGVGWDAKGKKFADPGRFDMTEKDADKGKFKTPTLRNVTDTAPYMHDGSEATLRDVMVLYNRGGNANPGLDAKMKALNLSDTEIDALVAFMFALTGPVTNAEPPAPGSLPK
ncbi:MAG: cytochrome c peroxidase [Candidatus Binatia bacterium]|nr:cytochrome c peroxidase [Candidatus Binatia bacterium]